MLADPENAKKKTCIENIWPTVDIVFVCQGHTADFAGSTNEEEKTKSPDEAHNSASCPRRCPAQFLFTSL